MNLKRLIVASVALAALSPVTWAEDVTETYLVNPSFEKLLAADGTTAVTVKLPLSDGLYGWDIMKITTNGHYQVESLSSKSSTGFPADGAFAASDGTYYYFNRKGWGSESGELKTTTSQAVPAGLYYFVFDYKAADYSHLEDLSTNGTTLGINVYGSDGKTTVASLPVQRHSYSIANNGSSPDKDSYMVDAAWKKMGILFNLKESQVLTFSIVQNLKNEGRSDVAYDNCRLIKVDCETDVTGVISNYDFEQRDAESWTDAALGNIKPYSTATNSYFLDKGGQTVATYNMYQTVSLPAGTYKLGANARASNNSGLTEACVYAQVSDTYDSEIYKATILQGGDGDTTGELGYGWDPTSTEFVLFEPKDVKIGFLVETNTSAWGWASADDFSITYLRETSNDDLATLYAKKVEKAKASKETIDTKNGTDTRSDAEKTALESKINAAPSSYADVAELKGLVDRYEYAVDNADEIETASKTEEVRHAYTYSYASVLSTDLTKWEEDDFVTNNGTEHWSGADKYQYYEQSFSEWNSDAAWSHHAGQSVELPEGKYVMFIASRAEDGVTSTMSVTIDDSETKTVSLPTEGNTGRGISTDGVSTFAYDATYAKEGEGQGWKYSYVEFETSGTQTVKIAFDASSAAGNKNKWVSIADPLLYGNVHPNSVYLNKLSGLVADLEKYNSTDVKMSKDLYNSFSETIASAKAATVDTEQATLESLIATITEDIEKSEASVKLYGEVKATVESTEATLKAAFTEDESTVVSTYEKEVAPVLTAYNEGTFTDATDQYTAIKAARVAAVLSQTQDNADMTLALENPSFEEGKTAWTFESKGMTSAQERTDATNPKDGKLLYNTWGSGVSYSNVYQTLTLPKGAYTLSAWARTNATPLEDKTIVCAYAGADLIAKSAGLTYDESITWNSLDAWQQLTATFNLLEETTLNLGIYSEGTGETTSGWYQVDNFQLTRNSEPTTSYTRSVTNNYGTICLPHASSATTGIAKLYKVKEITSSTVTIEEQESTALTAGVPYIFKKESDAEQITVTYTGNPVPDAVSDDYLVGSLSSFTVPVGNYVLQSDEFRKVATENFAGTANRAYLNGDKVPAAASESALRISFGDETTTAIDAVEALTSGKAEIYDLSGRKQSTLRKGINIVNGVKIIVK